MALLTAATGHVLPLQLACNLPANFSCLILSGVALLTVATQPRRLWRAQLPRLVVLAAFLFLATAIGSDGVPPVTQPRIASAAQACCGLIAARHV